MKSLQVTDEIIRIQKENGGPTNFPYGEARDFFNKALSVDFPIGPTKFQGAKYDTKTDRYTGAFNNFSNVHTLKITNEVMKFLVENDNTSSKPNVYLKIEDGAVTDVALVW